MTASRLASDPVGPVMEGTQDYGRITDRVLAPVLRRPGLGWIGGAGMAFSLVLLMATSVAWLLAYGVGVWGLDIPVAWGFAIVNFIWWVGIGHAGTLISAILLLVRKRWRTSINRFAEAMTLFAVAQAGLFPLLHLGRIWKFYFLFPYPDTLGVWPQWRSPLIWDMIAVLTYGTVSFLFWYVGLLPDLATLRDGAVVRWKRKIAGVFALGWRGSAAHWHRHQTLYLLLAGIATPLVVSVHSIVSLDFAVSILPGWHTTVFPPYWVAGAIYSGFAMVLTLTIPLRRAFHLKDLITARHLDNLAKMLLLFGLIVAYGYLMETFTAFFSGDPFERATMIDRATGTYAAMFWVMIACNVVLVQALWFRAVRRRPVVLFVISLLCNLGIWSDHYTVVVSTLHHDYMPSAWGSYLPTFWDWGLLLGSIGFFTLLFLLFVKLVPAMAMYELKELSHEEGLDGGAPGVPRQGGAGEEVAELHGVAAEFDRPEPLLVAVRAMRRHGFRRMDAYTPWPVAGMADALGLRRFPLPALMLLGGLGGGAAAFLMMWYSAVIDYPWNIGGRPFDSWPAFIPVTFELTILGAAVVGVVSMLLLNRLPQPYHPMFNLAGFARASRDRFFLCIETDDPRFERHEVKRLLEDLGPLRIDEVRS